MASLPFRFRWDSRGAIRASHGVMPERKLRVLFIDDCEPACRATRRVLREHEITCATSARAALALIVGQAEHFDAILCDLHMPETSGEDFFHVLASARPTTRRA